MAKILLQGISYIFNADNVLWSVTVIPSPQLVGTWQIFVFQPQNSDNKITAQAQFDDGQPNIIRARKVLEGVLNGSIK